MTETDRHIQQDSFYAQRDSIASPPSERPWPLVALAVACIGGVIAGSLGPWSVFERISETAPDTWTIPDYQSDGLFALVLATVALAALGVALFREGGEPWAWAAFGALALCALIGLADWFMFAPPDRAIPPGESGTVERLGWGVRVVGVAGPIGAVATWLIARRLDRGDF